MIIISNQINEPTVFPKASHDALFTNKSTFLLNTLIFYYTHEFLSIAECAYYATLHIATLKITIYLYYGFLALFYKWY